MLTRTYQALEKHTPAVIKSWIPVSWRIWVGYHMKVAWSRRRHAYPTEPIQKSDPITGIKLERFEPALLMRPLELPAGETEESLSRLIGQFYIAEDGPHPERLLYLRLAFRRLLYTLQLTPKRRGRLLEIGSAPYYITLLLRHFTPHELTLTNYFNATWGTKNRQTLVAGDGQTISMEFDHFNIETSAAPYGDSSFDIILLCEVLEHMTIDPYHVVTEIRRILRRDGVLVLTTPNATRLRNVEAICAGKNVWDDYSAYGAYGRHNREYTLPEIERLLRHAGFSIELAFTSDIEPYVPMGSLSLERLAQFQREPAKQRGEYIFVRARADGKAQVKRPAWLFRSYPADQTIDLE